MAITRATSVTPTTPATPTRPATPTKTAAQSPIDSFQPAPKRGQVALTAQAYGGPPISQRGSEAVSRLKGAQSDYDNAKSAADAKDEQLAKQLNQLGPGLTAEQRQAYVDGFHKKYRSTYDAVTKSAKALANEFQRDHDALLSAAGNGQAGQIYDALKDLAASPAGKEALDFAHDAFQDPGSAAATAFRSGGYDFQNEVIAPASQGMVSEALAEGGSLSDAITEAKEQLETLLSVPDFKGALDEVHDSWTQLDQVQRILAKGGADRFEKVKAVLEQESEAGPLARVIGGLGLACAAENARESGSSGDYLSMVQSLAETSKGALELVKDNSKFFSGALKLIGVEKDAGEVAKFAEKLIPGLGLATNALSVAVDVQRMTGGDFNAGDAVSLLGDSLATMGSAIALVPGGQLPGELIDGIGSVISIGGGWISDAINAKANADEERDLLSQAGVSSILRDALVNANANDMHLLADRGGLSTDQMQGLIDSFPNLVDGGFHDALQWLVKLKEDDHLSSDNLDTLLYRVGNSELQDAQGNQTQDYARAFLEFQQNLDQRMTNAEEQNVDGRSEGELLRAVIGQLANGNTDDSANRASIMRIFSGVASFLDEAGVPRARN